MAALVASAGQLANVLALLIFFMVIFSVMGVQLFKGVQSRRYDTARVPLCIPEFHAPTWTPPFLPLGLSGDKDGQGGTLFSLPRSHTLIVHASAESCSWHRPL